MINKKTVIIAEDHTLVRKGVMELFEKNNEFIIVAEAANGDELIKKYFDYFPDIIISDINMPVKNGLLAAKLIRKKDPNAKILFLSMYDDKKHIYKALKAGAMGLINKNIDEGILYLALRKIINGETFFPSYQSKYELAKLVDEVEKEKDFSIEDDIIFSDREKEVLNYLTLGLKSEEIASKLFISKRTVDLYRSRLIQKLNLKSSIELITFANQYKNDFGLADIKE